MVIRSSLAALTLVLMAPVAHAERFTITATGTIQSDASVDFLTNPVKTGSTITATLVFESTEGVSQDPFNGPEASTYNRGNAFDGNDSYLFNASINIGGTIITLDPNHSPFSDTETRSGTFDSGIEIFTRNSEIISTEHFVTLDIINYVSGDNRNLYPLIPVSFNVNPSADDFINSITIGDASGTIDGILTNLKLDNPLFPIPTSSTPEPTTWAMILLGFGTMGLLSLRRKFSVSEFQIRFFRGLAAKHALEFRKAAERERAIAARRGEQHKHSPAFPAVSGQGWLCWVDL